MRTMKEFAEAITRIAKDWPKEDPRWQDLIEILKFNEVQVERRIAARNKKQDG